MVITSDDIRNMSPKEIRETEEDFDVQVDEISFSSFTHHFTVKYRLGALIDRDVITEAEATWVEDKWKGDDETN